MARALTTLQGGSSKAISDISLAPRLKSFFNSATYGQQAIDLSKRLMGSLANYAAFTDLFATVFPKVEITNLDDLLDIGRKLDKTNNDVIRTCARLTQALKMPAGFKDNRGICAESHADVLSIINESKNYSELEDIRNRFKDLGLELAFESEQIFNVLKKMKKQTGSPSWMVSTFSGPMQKALTSLELIYQELILMR